MTAREEMISLMSDLYKDVYGFRPRIAYSTWSTADLQAEWDFLIEKLDRSIELEKQAYQNARERYDAYIYQLMIDHGISKADAIRWDLNGAADIDHHLWEWGLNMTDTYEIIEELRQAG